MLIRFFLVYILLFTSVCFGETTFEQTFTTTVPASVNVSSINTALASGTINASTGNISSPSASFRLQTNGADSNYTYVIQAKLLTQGGAQHNAYAQIAGQPYILLGNNSSAYYPTLDSVNNIKSANPVASNNPNVIAYPVVNTLNNLESATFVNNSTYGGLCYIIKTGNNKNGTIAQTLGATPLANTYSTSADRAGVYQATVTFSANRNP